MSKQGASILVVDDEREIVRALQRSLTAHGYRVFTARSGEEAIEEVARHRPDLLLLDLLLPGISGLEVTRWVRERSSVPIIVLSVKEAERDKVEALDSGADDYVAKPFGMNEVLARVRVALRHAAHREARAALQVFEAGPLSVDLAARRVMLAGELVHLTPIEFKLLGVLVRHAGRVVTHAQLLREVWGPGSASETRYLRVYMTHLRRKLEPRGGPRLFVTEAGVGYRLPAEDEPD